MGEAKNPAYDDWLMYLATLAGKPKTQRSNVYAVTKAATSHTFSQTRLMVSLSCRQSQPAFLKTEPTFYNIVLFIGDDFVDKAIGFGFIRTHPIIAVSVLLYFAEFLTSIFC